MDNLAGVSAFVQAAETLSFVDAGRVLGEAQDRNRIIQKRLKGIDALDTTEQKSLEEQFFEGE